MGIDPQEDVVPKTGKDYSKNPEAGSGVKYTVEKRIRLKGGEKTVFFGAPDDGCCKSIRIVLREGKENILEFRPVYGKPGRGTVRNFMSGIERLEAYFNGERVE